MLMGMTSSANGVGKAWQPGEKRVKRLCFIGRNLDRDELNKSFQECLTKEVTSDIKTEPGVRRGEVRGGE